MSGDVPEDGFGSRVRRLELPVPSMFAGFRFDYEDVPRTNALVGYSSPMMQRVLAAVTCIGFCVTLGAARLATSAERPNATPDHDNVNHHDHDDHHQYDDERGSACDLGDNNSRDRGAIPTVWCAAARHRRCNLTRTRFRRESGQRLRPPRPQRQPQRPPSTALGVSGAM